MNDDRPAWRTSSHSGSSGCVEVSPLPEGTGIRDSKNPHGGELHVPRTTWRAFVRGIAAG